MDETVAPPTSDVRLTPRQRECLRYVYQRRTSKEIAALTGLAVGTVDTYIAEAVTALGARNRRHAAELLHATSPDRQPGERAGAQPDPPPATPGSPTPRKPAPQVEPLADISQAADTPKKLEPEQTGVEPVPMVAPSTPRRTTAQHGAAWLPIRLQGAIGNDLGPVARLVSILAFAIALAIGFGMLAAGMRTLSDLLAAAR